MKKIISLFVLALGVTTIYSQHINTSYKDALEIKKRVLLVGLPADDKYLLDMYEQDSAAYVTLYSTEMEGQRQALKEAVVNHWKFTDSIVITSYKEAKSLIKKFPEKYVLLHFGEQLQDRVYVRHGKTTPPLTCWENRDGKFIYNARKRYSVKMLGITSLVLELPKRVFEVHLPKMSPSTGDFIYAIRQMEYVLSDLLKSEESTANKLYRNVYLVSEELKTKTLLIDAKEVNCSAEDIKKAYPYPFKLVSYDVIDDALKNKDDNFAIIQASRFDTQNSTHYVVNAGNGKIYSNFNDNTFNYGEQHGYSVMVLYPFITSKELERYKSGN